MITETVGSYLFVAGVVSLLILRIFGGKYWYVFLLLGIGFIGSRMAMDNIVIVKDNNVKEEYLTFLDNFDYTFFDGRKCEISVRNNTIINDSPKKVIIEKVEYSRVESLNFGDNIEFTISPYQYTNLVNSVDFYYTEPPKTISVRSGASCTRYWLHN